MFSLTFNGKVIFLIVDIKNLRHHITINTAGYVHYSEIIRRGYLMIHKMLVHFTPFSERDLIKNNPMIFRCKDCARYHVLTCPRDRFWLTLTKEVPSYLFRKNTLPANGIATSMTSGDSTREGEISNALPLMEK
jgi:hypothetical protein